MERLLAAKDEYMRELEALLGPRDPGFEFDGIRESRDDLPRTWYPA